MQRAVTISRLGSPWLALSLFAALAVTGCRERATTSTDAPSPASDDGTITVEIVDGGQTESYDVVGFPASSTVESIMRSLKGPEVIITGSGVTAFVDSIGGKSTSSSEGWTFTVDGEFATEGIGSTTVDPPVTIRWTYGEEP